MRTKLTALAVALVVVLAGCGSSTEEAAGFNDADVAFATGMIPHHQQAIAMSELAPSRAKDVAVKELAAKITAAQGPEIATLTGWLKEWDQPVPEAYDPDAESEHSGHHMDGMMTSADMATLAGRTGAAFDSEFLKQMIEHHEGAIDMAKDEQKSGAHAEATALAKQIVKDQTAEIALMRGLLKAP